MSKQVRVTATFASGNLGAIQELAKQTPVYVTRAGRDDVVVLSMDRFARMTSKPIVQEGQQVNRSRRASR